jgi:hypothetical protein
MTLRQSCEHPEVATSWAGQEGGDGGATCGPVADVLGDVPGAGNDDEASVGGEAGLVWCPRQRGDQVVVASQEQCRHRGQGRVGRKRHHRGGWPLFTCHRDFVAGRGGPVVGEQRRVRLRGNGGCGGVGAGCPQQPSRLGAVRSVAVQGGDRQRCLRLPVVLDKPWPPTPAWPARSAAGASGWRHKPPCAGSTDRRAQPRRWQKACRAWSAPG